MTDSRLLGPAEVRALAAELGLRPTKRLGQNFVHDPNTVRRIVKAGFARDKLVNVNFPGCEADEVLGVSVTRQGQRNQDLLKIDARRDGRGQAYFWILFGSAAFEIGEGTDLEAIRGRKISVTPLKIDLTDEAMFDGLAAAFSDA